MNNLDVKHYLGVYKTRLAMQNSGITNPTKEVKIWTKIIVDKLSLLPLDEKVEICENSFIDSKGNVIATLLKK